MQNPDDFTLLDAWPLFALAALALFAFIVVFRGMGRPPDSSQNKSSGGGSHFFGRGGRW